MAELDVTPASGADTLIATATAWLEADPDVDISDELSLLIAAVAEF